jgi:hypothetical protein
LFHETTAFRKFLIRIRYPGADPRPDTVNVLAHADVESRTGEREKDEEKCVLDQILAFFLLEKRLHIDLLIQSLRRGGSGLAVSSPQAI